MSRRIVLDWDDRQVRMLALDGHGAGVRFREAQTAPLPDSDRSANNVSQALEPLVAKHRVAKTEAIVLAGNRDVQFRLLRVPPVPADELPDLVRLRAAADFSALDDAAVIDFHPFAHQPSEPQCVLAGRLSAKSAATRREVCKILQLTPVHIVPRGCGLAWLAAELHPKLKTGVHAVVCLRANDIDLVAMRDGAAAVVRSVPLQASDDDELVQSAVREMRRTLAAVTSDLDVDQIESIVWLTGDQRDTDVSKRVGDELGQTIMPLNVDHASEFAGLLGAGKAAAGGKLAIDFLSPKKRLETGAPKRTVALAAAAGLLILAGISWWLYDRVASIERATITTTEQREQIESEVSELAADREHSEKVAAWLATDVNWLDELDRLTMSLRPKELDDKEFDASSDVLLTSLIANKAPGTRGVGGKLALGGRVRDDGVLEAMEQRLRDSHHEVDPKNVISDSQSQPYVWVFQTDIAINPSLPD
ncbi:MAG: hypothetical protein ACR2NU_14700 [Aeoliella sp.]